MAFQNMIQELLGIPGVNFGLIKIKLNEALQAIQNENVWSFQLQTGGWLTPGLLGGPTTQFLSPGTITVTPFTTTITGDATATAAWLGTNTNPPFITQYQIRVPYYSLYNIIALGNNGTLAYATINTAGSSQTPGTYTVAVSDAAGIGVGATVQIVVDSTGAVTQAPVTLTAGSGYKTPYISFSHGGTPATFLITLMATLTLDRPWMEPSQTNAGYMAYQAYFPAPAGFKRWYNVRDTTNNNQLDWWSKTQIDLANEDAERTDFQQPLYVVPYGPDTRTGSATYGQMLFELWPHPITQLPYTFGCQANWPLLTNVSDTVPFPLTEELVKLRASEMLSLWKESQKGDEMERGSGADWKFLSQANRAEYDNRLKTIRVMDKHLADLYFTKMQRFPSAFGEPYATTTGQLNVGGWGD
jgi:hypothetical protein